VLVLVREATGKMLLDDKPRLKVPLYENWVEFAWLTGILEGEMIS